MDKGKNFVERMWRNQLIACANFKLTARVTNARQPGLSAEGRHAPPWKTKYNSEFLHSEFLHFQRLICEFVAYTRIHNSIASETEFKETAEGPAKPYTHQR